MKKTIVSLLLFIAVMLAVPVLFAQPTNTTSTLPGVGESIIPQTLSGYWDMAIAAVSPIIVWFIAWLAPKIPKQVLPCITPLVGIGLGLALQKLAGVNLSWYDAAKAGALAVFIREVVNQNVTKYFQTPTPTAPT